MAWSWKTTRRVSGLDGLTMPIALADCSVSQSIPSALTISAGCELPGAALPNSVIVESRQRDSRGSREKR